MKEQASILNRYPDYEATIGIEVHVQLATKSKLFCSCVNAFTTTPNIHICNICTAQPGSLPVLNKKVVDYAILSGLATNCTIAELSTFARKHYFYPDLPKNYQITQDSKPICTDGSIPIRLENGSVKVIRLMRIHIEEDAGKNIHVPESNESLVDLNRAGTPLLEIVSYPDIANAFEARAYLKSLHLLVRYLGISTGNMEEGAFRADTNISVKKKSSRALGTRCELKNINSFKFIGDAIEYELQRQLELVSRNESVRQETRLWDTKQQITIPMRTKEEAADYRYFQDPDLPLVQISQEWQKRIEHQLPELPHQKYERLLSKGLTPYEADILIQDIDLAHYYESAQALTSSPLLINWILRDLLGYIKEHNLSITQCNISPDQLAELVSLIENGTINSNTAKQVFMLCTKTGKSPLVIVKEENLEQIESLEMLESIINTIVAQHPNQLKAYKSGKTKLFGFFVGQVMKATEGKANPSVIKKLLQEYLSH